MKQIVHIASIAMLLASCQLSNDVDLRLPDQKSFYVVEAVLKPGKPMELSFIESIRMNDAASLNFVWNADARFIQGNDTIPLMNFLFLRKEDSVVVNYTSKRLLPYQTNGSLTLFLKKGNDTLTATAHFIKPVTAKSCKVNGLDIDATIENSFASNDRFFRMEAFLYQPNKKKRPRYSQIYNLNNCIASELLLHLKVGNVARDSLKVVISHISKEHYEYLYSSNRAFDAYFDPFAVPTQIKSNIKGGLGIFTVVSEDTLSFKSQYP